MALIKNRHLLESYLDSSDEEDDEDGDDSDEEEDKPMEQNRIPLFKRHPIEDKHNPVVKRT